MNRQIKRFYILLFFLTFAVLVLAFVTRKEVNPYIKPYQNALFYQSQRGNAAQPYIEAVTWMAYPNTMAARLRIRRVIEFGWLPQLDGLRQTLKRNERAFLHAKQAFQYKRCLFNPGQNVKNPLLRELPPIRKMEQLAYLHLLRAQQRVFDGIYDEALDDLLGALTISTHLAQDSDSMSKRQALRLNRLSLYAIRTYLKKTDIPRDKMLLLVNYLGDLDRGFFPARRIVDIEKRYYIANLLMLENNIRQDLRIEDNPQHTFRRFRKTLLQQGGRLANDYYGKMTRAIERNDAMLWRDALLHNEDLKLAMQTGHTDHEWLFDELLYNLQLQLNQMIQGGRQDAFPEVALQMAKLTLASSLQFDFQAYMDLYNEVRNELAGLRADLKRKLLAYDDIKTF